ncbi:hypothetical protein [Vibrio alginolyticus]|uniref:hypothetical protein n=1 Tax=Vibrio alginolyticus TaxID=663 RepID=UPI002FF2E752
MPINYLYIDDDEFRDISAFTKQLCLDSNIYIEHIQVKEIPEIVKIYKEGCTPASGETNNFDGFIIDQELVKKSKEGKRADYHGTTLAQHLRTEMAMGNIFHCPLILLSNNKNVVKSFKPDDTSSNLFDYVIIKDDLTKGKFAERARKVLLDVVDAYKQVLRPIGKDEFNKQEIQNLLGCNDNIYKFVDSRFIDYLKSKSKMPHAIVSCIYTSLVRSAGMLSTEQMLATKLGVDIENSADWHLVLKRFEFAKYKGPFCNIKQRWWSSAIEFWWYEESESGEPLNSLSCSDRVQELRSILGTENLTPISLKYKSGDQSDRLWVNCVVSGTPLDPYDALRVRESDLMPWEQPKYMDITAVLKREHKTKGYEIHSDDVLKRDILKARLRPDVNAH